MQKMRTSEAVTKLSKLLTEKQEKLNPKQEKKKQLEQLQRSEKDRRKLEKDLREECEKSGKLLARLQDEIGTFQYLISCSSRFPCLSFTLLDKLFKYLIFTYTLPHFSQITLNSLVL